MTVSGAGGVLGMLVTVTVRGEGLAGPAASRPRGRPFAAYVVSCVGMMTLSSGRLTDPSRCDSINRPDLNDDQAFNALSTKILTLPSRVERPPSDAIARLWAPRKGRYPVRLRGCRHHDCCWRRTRSSRASQPPTRRHYPPLLRSGTTRNRSPPARSAPAPLSNAQTPIVAARAAAMGSPANSLPRIRL